MATLDLPWGAWYGDGPRRFAVPNSWDCDLLAPPEPSFLSQAEVAESLDRPIGVELDETARGCRSACVVIDDLARPTPAAVVLPPLLDRLHACGISSRHISILAATGTHAALDERQLRLKVGDEIYERYRVLSHDCDGDLAGTGIAYGDHELRLNRVFLAAECRIVVGSVLPHSFAGYSGGAKLILPGLADKEATARSHRFVQLGLRGGSLTTNRFRTEAEDFARRLDVNFCVCVTTDARQRVTGCWTGDLTAAHRAACREAAEMFRTPVRRDYDVLLINAFPKDVDLVQAENAFVALKDLPRPIVRENGTFVLMTAASEGLGRHGLFSAGGKNYLPPRPKRHLAGRDLWIYSPTVSAEDVRTLYWDGYRPYDDFGRLCRDLSERLTDRPAVGVLPCAAMQQLVWENTLDETPETP